MEIEKGMEKLRRELLMVNRWWLRMSRGLTSVWVKLKRVFFGPSRAEEKLGQKFEAQPAPIHFFIIIAAYLKATTAFFFMRWLVACQAG